MRVWVSKYALSKGILEYEAEMASNPRTVKVSASRGFGSYLYHDGEWHRTEAEARARADEMRVAKIASHRRAIARLEKMTFTK